MYRLSYSEITDRLYHIPMLYTNIFVLTLGKLQMLCFLYKSQRVLDWLLMEYKSTL